jgi:hypothetical protein
MFPVTPLTNRFQYIYLNFKLLNPKLFLVQCLSKCSSVKQGFSVAVRIILQ